MNEFHKLLSLLREKSSFLHQAIEDQDYEKANLADDERNQIITYMKSLYLTDEQKRELSSTVSQILLDEQKFRIQVEQEKEKTAQELSVFVSNKKANSAYKAQRR